MPALPLYESIALEALLDSLHVDSSFLASQYLPQTTVCYFLIDLIWVACVPSCVKSPDVIIKVRVCCCCVRVHVSTRIFTVRVVLICSNNGSCLFSPLYINPHSRIDPTASHFYTASLCRHCLPFRSDRLARIPLVHGRLLVGGNQYLVSHSPTSPLQTQGSDTPGDYRARVAVVLSVLDCHSHLFVSNDHVHFLANGLPKSY